MKAGPQPTERFAPLPETLLNRPADAEQEILAGWRQGDVFDRLQAARAGARPFVFWEGPPTANGRPGIHHVLARTIKDAVCRFHTMLGERVERKAGWDTHGLPVELEVEKALGISGKPAIESLPLDPATGLAGVARFNDECRKSVWKYKGEWERLSERVGFWLDYSDPYVTYDPRYVESVWSLLQRFHEHGLVYRGQRVLPYCTRCGTGLSSHELGQPGVYRDVSDPSVVVRFRLAEDTGGSAAPKRATWKRESFLAWTTTPWTLPSNFALAVHPDREYVKVRISLQEAPPGGPALEDVWIVRERLAAVLGQVEWEEVESRKGRELIGLPYEPLFDSNVPSIHTGVKGDPDPRRWHRVVGAEFVSVEDGTGIVHQAPYGADDWETAVRERLAVLPEAVGPDGRFTAPVLRPRRGQEVVPRGTALKDADPLLIRDLEQRGLLFRRAQENHSYPHCWRCDTPLIYFPSPAWFIRTTAYRERMIELNRGIRWVPPEVGEKRFGEWLENNVDWNISRDRYWGTPLPFWICDRCGAEVALGSAEEIAARAGGLPAGFDSHKPSVDAIVFPCAGAGCSGTMRRTSAVLDCWFDSGAMPYAQYHWPFAGSRAKVADQFPASFIAEGLDQTRGWFYTLHAIGAFLTDPASGAGLPDGPAYRTCVVNGLVLDKDGVKMSKRLGNVVDPWRAIEEHGADAVRWYLVASGNPWLPKRFDPKGLLEVRRGFLGTLINSYNFFALYARLDDGFDPDRAAVPPVAERPAIDRWLVSRAQSLLRDVRSRMASSDLAGACHAIEEFTVEDLSRWYIRRNRARFWKSADADKLAAFATLHGALRTVVLSSAPLAPFLAETLWRRLSGEESSVHAAILPEPDDSVIDGELERSMQIVVRVVEMGRALRERAGIKTRQPLRAIHLRAPDRESLRLLREPFATDLILGELNVKSWGSLDTDDGQLCRLRARANFRVLGKRIGPLMKSAAAAIEALPPERVSELRSGRTVDLELGGTNVTLGQEDVQIALETQADFDVETDGRFVVFLDTELDDDLRDEGLAREVINRINGLRKDRGLAVEDRIVLWLDARGVEAVERALRRHADLIERETLAVELRIGDGASADEATVHFDLGDGNALNASLVRA